MAFKIACGAAWRTSLHRARFNLLRSLCPEIELPELAANDWLILMMFVLTSIGIGVSMRSGIKSGKDYFQAGRSFSTWACALAFIGAGLGAPEVIGMGAAGASFGFHAALYFLLGGIPALLFVGLYMLPRYYRSGTVTLPGYLGVRFDTKTRVLSAAMFVAMAIKSAGIALFMVARVLQGLHIFDRLFVAYGWSRGGIFPVCILLAAVPVLIYTTVAGLRGTIVSQVLQFFLLVVGFLPAVWAGLKNVGGWNGLNASLASVAPQSTTTAGGSVAALAVLLGFVLGAARWTTDFRVLQMAMAAKTAESARKIPVIAAAVLLAIPFLLVLPGAIAIAVPTPESKTVVHNVNGTIYHEITIVPKAMSEGRGLVPAIIDPATNNARLDAAGNKLLDYGMATPNVVTRFASTGLLGLVIAALLASLMSGVGSTVAAVSAVFTCDLYQPLLRNDASDANLLRTARWTSAASVILAVVAAFAVAALFGKGSAAMTSTWLSALALVFSILQAPEMATFVLGVFTRRINGAGAFAGLIAGFVVALLHYSLTVAADAQAGLLQGGWLGVLYRYPGIPSQLFFAVVFSFVANAATAWVVSQASRSRLDAAS
jgi:SSS family solute:Na+ symporter